MVAAPDWLTSRTRRGSHSISPTAHYTGYVWAHHELGDPALATVEGRVMHGLGRLLLTPVELLGGPTLEHFLLARHRVIDHLLEQRLRSGAVTHVVELACGMSPRGLELVRRHPALTYVEVDLPAMAARKRDALRRIGTDEERHRVEAADVLSGELAEVFERLGDPGGVAVVTEGLLNYFPTDQVVGLWSRLAEQLRAFPSGTYLSDLHVASTTGVADRLFAAGLGLAVRGRVHFHFPDEAAAAGALRSVGFASAELHAPSAYAGVLPGMTAAGADRVRVVEAQV
jgi:O-methyltransferase involved in polyketide biosynthesis